MWSTPRDRASSIVASQVLSERFERPKMRSMLRFSMPASRTIFMASRAWSAVWRRFIQRRRSSSKDCMPMLIRSTPKVLRLFTYGTPFITMSSGFTSMVNSAQGPPWPQSARVRRIFVRDGRGSSEGVPPPKYRVGSEGSISLCRARISAQTASVYFCTRPSVAISE